MDDVEESGSESEETDNEKQTLLLQMFYLAHRRSRDVFRLTDPMLRGTLLPKCLSEHLVEMSPHILDFYLCRNPDIHQDTWAPNSLRAANEFTVRAGVVPESSGGRAGVVPESSPAKRNCGFFGLAQSWISNASGHWRCPMCGHRYRPYAEQGSIPANKLLVVQAKEFDIRLSWLLVRQGSVLCLPYLSVPSPEVSLQERIKEISLGQRMAEEHAAEPEEEALRSLKAITMMFSGRYSFFRPLQLSRVAKAEVDYVNQQGQRNQRKPFEYRHLLKGFSGARFQYTPGEPVLDTEALGAIWRDICQEDGLAQLGLVKFRRP